MVEIKIKQVGLNLSLIDSNEIPCTGSSNIPVTLESDTSYSEYTKELHVSYFIGNKEVHEILEKENEKYILTANVFANDGICKISLHLRKDGTTIVTKPIKLEIEKSPNGIQVFPVELDWQTMISEYLKGLNINSVEDSAVEFVASEERINILSGETVKIIFGKISKWISDLDPVAFSGSYNDLIDKPSNSTVPTKTSELINDSGFLTKHQDISGKQDKIDNNLMTTSKDIVDAINELFKLIRDIDLSDIVLSNYYTKEEINDELVKLANFLDEMLNNYYKQEDIDEIFTRYFTKDEITILTQQALAQMCTPQQVRDIVDEIIYDALNSEV